MPYQIVFTKTFPVPNTDDYVSGCCWGGDVVARRLLPVVEVRCRDIRCNQGDRGWFILFRDGAVNLAIDISCDDPAMGLFRVHLTSKTRKWVSSRIVDSPELEMLKKVVLAQLALWPVSGLSSAKLDEEYREVQWA